MTERSINRLEWEAKTASLKNFNVIVQHGSFLYLNDWLGVKQDADLEPKAGIPPTISHLESLLKTTLKNRSIAPPMSNISG